VVLIFGYFGPLQTRNKVLEQNTQKYKKESLALNELELRVIVSILWFAISTVFINKKVQNFSCDFYIYYLNFIGNFPVDIVHHMQLR